MIKLFSSILLLNILAFSPCYAQDYDPIQLVKKVLEDDNFNNIKEYSTGEFNGHPNKKDINNLKISNYRLLDQNDKTAVVNITFTDSLNENFDTYFHLKKENIWKICAFRALAMTGMLKSIWSEYGKLNDSEIDSLITKMHKIIPESDEFDKTYDIYKSKESFKNYLNNIKLTLSSDDEIIGYFFNNKEKFNVLKNNILSLIIENKNVKNDYLNNHFKYDIQNLLLTNISFGFEECETCLIFTIGGILDNSVGFMYISDKKNIPEMHPSFLIMLREIEEGWYIFKTT